MGREHAVEVRTGVDGAPELYCVRCHRREAAIRTCDCLTQAEADELRWQREDLFRAMRREHFTYLLRMQEHRLAQRLDRTWPWICSVLGVLLVVSSVYFVWNYLEYIQRENEYRASFKIDSLKGSPTTPPASPGTPPQPLSQPPTQLPSQVSSPPPTEFPPPKPSKDPFTEKY